MSRNLIPLSFRSMSRPFSAEPLMIIATETRVTARPTPAAASMPTAVRPCRKEDLARVAEIHKARFALPGTLLGQLSPTLIAGLYASFFGRATFLVHATGGDVNGFVLGGSSRAMTRCKLSFFRKYALLCIVDVVRRPQLWTRAFHAFVKLIGDWSSSASETAPREEFRMVSIAVSPRDAKRRRHGAGSRVRGGDGRRTSGVQPQCLENQCLGNPLLRAVGFSLHRRNCQVVDAAQGIGRQCRHSETAHGIRVHSGSYCKASEPIFWKVRTASSRTRGLQSRNSGTRLGMESGPILPKVWAASTAT